MKSTLWRACPVKYRYPNSGSWYDFVHSMLPTYINLPFHLVSISRRIVLWRNHQTSTLLRTLINRLDNVYQLLFVLQHPIQLVIVACSEIAHHVLVPVEEED
jgi:hypothetical protein